MRGQRSNQLNYVPNGIFSLMMVNLTPLFFKTFPSPFSPKAKNPLL